MEQFISFSEEQLIELIKKQDKYKLINKEIELIERCLTRDGGLKLFFKVKEVKGNSSQH